MKAVIRENYVTFEKLSIKEVDKPIPKDNEVLVKVYATTVNRSDCAVVTGVPFIMRLVIGLIKPKLSITGTDFAGVIEAIGNNVKGFKVGDNVWGLNDEGLSSHAAYMTIKEDAGIIKMHESQTFQEAAACAEGAHYAYNTIKKLNFKKGDKVLVYGATGAIGSAALQIAKHFGAYVTAVGNTKNIQLLKDLGADKTYDYLTEDFTQDEERYQFVFDAVGKSSFGVCRKLMLPEGIYVSSELGPGYENIYLPLLTKIKGGQRVVFPIPTDCRRSLLFINELIENGEYKAVIDRTYKPEDIIDAFEYVSSGQKTGNVIIDFENF